MLVWCVMDETDVYRQAREYSIIISDNQSNNIILHRSHQTNALFVYFFFFFFRPLRICETNCSY